MLCAKIGVETIRVNDRQCAAFFELAFFELRANLPGKDKLLVTLMYECLSYDNGSQYPE